MNTIIGMEAYLDVGEMEDKTDVMEAFMILDEEINRLKWRTAKTWMFGHEGELTDEQYLAVAGLI